MVAARRGIYRIEAHAVTAQIAHITADDAYTTGLVKHNEKQLCPKIQRQYRVVRVVRFTKKQ
jgi:hypothetical protein